MNNEDFAKKLNVMIAEKTIELQTLLSLKNELKNKNKGEKKEK